MPVFFPVSDAVVSLILSSDVMTVLVAHTFVWPDTTLPRLISPAMRTLVNINHCKYHHYCIVTEVDYLEGEKLIIRY